MVHEPTKLTMPEPKLSGPLYDHDKSEKLIDFDKEGNPGAKIYEGTGLERYNQPAKLSTDIISTL